MTTNSSGLVLALLGAGAMVLGLFVGSCGPAPGFGICVVPYEWTLTSYFLGMIGGALLVQGAWKTRVGQKYMSSPVGFVKGTNLSGVVLVFLGGVVITLDFMFTSPCLGTLMMPSAASCAISYGMALTAYILGVIGAGISVGGLWKIRIGQRGIPPEGLSPVHQPESHEQR